MRDLLIQAGSTILATTLTGLLWRAVQYIGSIAKSVDQIQLQMVRIAEKIEGHEQRLHSIENRLNKGE